MIASFFGMFIFSFKIFDKSKDARLRPEINRAMVQMARLLPQLEQNEKALRDAFDQMKASWDNIFLSGDFSLPYVYDGTDESNLEEVVNGTLSRLKRVTKLKVGRDGLVAVVSKETGRVVAHPSEKMVGYKLISPGDVTDDQVISASAIKLWTRPEDLDIEFSTLVPQGASVANMIQNGDFDSLFMKSVYGGMLSYQDYYIVCGIPAWEYVSYVILNALLFSFILLVLQWLFIRWICLEMNARRETGRSMRNKLLAYVCLLCVVLFGVTWYMQRLANVTNDLKTMSKHASAAVETLNTYETQRKELGDWLDKFYLTQCWIATILVDAEGKDNLTRETMQRYADALQVEYVYLFDKNGRVRVTNGPYDHLTLSTDPEDFTYAFLPLLEGVSYVLTAPMNDEWLREYVQYVGVSLRDENDLCDGFVLIGVDPTLRDSLLSPLNVDTVLNNMIIGLPEYAIAIDKNTLKVASTTGIGYVGVSIEDLGLTTDNLRADFNGFLKINGTQYYAGVSESSEYYLVPIVRRTNSIDSLLIALKLTLYALCTSLVITLLTLFRYQRVVIDGAPEPKSVAEPDPEAAQAADAEVSPRRSNIPNLLKAQKKRALMSAGG